jgi:hypothetical protein
MRKITDEWKSDIEDASTAELLANLPAAVAEKDVHITDVLRELSQISVSHVAHRQNHKKGDRDPARIEVKTHLVFAGGTCLSKAHGLIERMSEDIDIKIVLDDVPEGYALPGGRTDRARLGKILTSKSSWTTYLKAMHFPVAERIARASATSTNRCYNAWRQPDSHSP